MVGKKLRADARAGIKNPPKTGKTYRRRGRNRKSSAPGQYPANVTGNLRNSIDFLVRGDRELIFFQDERGGKNGKSVKYGKFLELGTRRMKPR